MQQARCKSLLKVDIPEHPYAKFQCDLGFEWDCVNCGEFEPEYCILSKGDPCEYKEAGDCTLTGETCVPVGRTEE